MTWITPPTGVVTVAGEVNGTNNEPDWKGKDCLYSSPSPCNSWPNKMPALLLQRLGKTGVETGAVKGTAGHTAACAATANSATTAHKVCTQTLICTIVKSSVLV